MPTGQGSRRSTVVGTARQPRAGRSAVLVLNAARWLVAHVPALLGEPPHEVNILAAAKRFVEAGPQRRTADDQGRAGHEWYPAPRQDPSTLRAAIQGRPDVLVAGQPTRAAPGETDDAWCDRPNERVGEVRQQLGEPAVLGHAVRVKKRDERCGS